MNASTVSVTVSKVRRSIRLVSQAANGEPTHSTIAPKVTSRPAMLMLTPRPDDNSTNMPVGASTEHPVTTFPSIKAVGAKRRATWDSMQMHVGRGTPE